MKIEWCECNVPRYSIQQLWIIIQAIVRQNFALTPEN